MGKITIYEFIMQSSSLSVAVCLSCFQRTNTYIQTHKQKHTEKFSEGMELLTAK
jgi:hypothetical protein